MKRRVVSVIVVSAGLFGSVAMAQDAAAPEVLPVNQPLFLTCTGAGTSTPTGSAFRVTHAKPYEGSLEIELFTDRDRIRLPIGMVPPLLRTDSGWYRIKDSNANERVINAITSINMFNTPQIRIDRVAGTMEISAVTGSFAGECEKIDRAAEAPKF